MKKSSTIRMSMFCPDVPPTPFGMMDRNVTKRRPPKSSKKGAEPSKLSLRRPEPALEPASDQENAPPSAAADHQMTPRRQGRRLFSQPEIAEIAADSPPSPPPPPPLARARPPLRQAAGLQRAERQTEKQQFKRTETEQFEQPDEQPFKQAETQQFKQIETHPLKQPETQEFKQPEPRCATGPGGELETEALMRQMTEMSLTETPAAVGRTEETAADNGKQAVPANLTDRMETGTRQEVSDSAASDGGPGIAVSSGQRCAVKDSPLKSPAPLPELGASADLAVPVSPSAGAGSEPQRPLSSDSFVSAASSPVVGRPTVAVRTPAAAPAPSAAPTARNDSDSDSDSERSLPYFTPRRAARRRRPAAVLESSDDDSAANVDPAPLVTRALRRLPATTSTPAPGEPARWRLDATGMPSPVMETEPTPAEGPGCRSTEGGTQQADRGERIEEVGGGVTVGDAGTIQEAQGRSGRLVADSLIIVGEAPAPETPQTLAGETPEDSSSSVEVVTPRQRHRKPTPLARELSPHSELRRPPVVAAPRAPLHPPGPVPSAMPPPLPPGVSATIDVARWLEESPFLTAVGSEEESDAVVIDSDQEWDDSDLLSVSERAAAAGVAPETGLETGRPRPELQEEGDAPRMSPPRRADRRSAGSSSEGEDQLEKFKRQFVTPKRQQRPPSPSSEEDDFIDDDPLSSDGDSNSSYRRAVAIDSVSKRNPRVDPLIRASDESLEPAKSTPEEPPLFRPPPTRQVKRTAGSGRSAQTPQRFRTLSFMSSLADNLMEGCQRHPEAATFVRSFRTKKLELARRLFDMINSEVFDSKLPADLEIKFNKRMLRTAGYCYSRHSTSSSCRSARVELSEKVVDSAERLRDTLVHELCHAAAWVVSDYRGGHGPVWRGWAGRVQRRFPELPPVTRCHSYQIHCKYTYRCTSCGYSFGRHSKSLDVTRKVCGRCRGVFECVLTAKQGVDGGPPTPATPRAAAPFAMFVKEHYSAVKSASAGLKHAEVMRLLGQKFAEAKISQAKAKATDCDDF